MPVAIDTSILVQAESLGGLEAVLPADEDGPFYIPALAATEFLLGTHPPVKDNLRYRALLLYQGQLKPLVSSFTEADAMEFASLSAYLKRIGQQMKFFDAAIAASTIARGDKLITADGDFERLRNRITLIRV